MAYAKVHDIRRFDVWNVRSLLFVDDYREQIDSLRFGDPPDAEPLDLAPLYRHHALLGLSLNRKRNPPDLSRLPALTSFVGCWHRGLRLEDSHAISTLNLTGFSEKNLQAFPWPASIKKVTFSHGSLASTLGIAAAPSTLLRLELDCSKQLVEVEIPSSSSLRELQIDTCGKARLGVLSPSLRVLGVDKAAPIPTLAFLDALPNLESFGFGSTSVEDGDMAPILRHPTIRYVQMVNKRHYSHSDKDIDAVMRERGGYAIWRVEDMGTEVRPFTRF